MELNQTSRLKKVQAIVEACSHQQSEEVHKAVTRMLRSVESLKEKITRPRQVMTFQRSLICSFFSDSIPEINFTGVVKLDSSSEIRAVVQALDVLKSPPKQKRERSRVTCTKTPKSSPSTNTSQGNNDRRPAGIVQGLLMCQNADIADCVAKKGFGCRDEIVFTSPNRPATTKHQTEDVPDVSCFFYFAKCAQQYQEVIDGWDRVLRQHTAGTDSPTGSDNLEAQPSLERRDTCPNISSATSVLETQRQVLRNVMNCICGRRKVGDPPKQCSAFGNPENLTGVTFDHQAFQSCTSLLKTGMVEFVTGLALPNRNTVSNCRPRLPSTIAQLRNLTEISLADRGLAGTLPSEIGLLVKLRKLFLFRNRLRGPIPSEIGNLKALTDFDASENSLTGNIPTELSRLVNLKHLDLGENRISGSIPNELANLTQLKVLWLGNNLLRGAVPRRLQTLPGLNLWVAQTGDVVSH